MAKPEQVSIWYRLNDDEVLTVAVRVRSSYPDAVAEATATARRLLRESLHDVLITTGREAFAITDHTGEPSDPPAGVPEDDEATPP